MSDPSTTTNSKFGSANPSDCVSTTNEYAYFDTPYFDEYTSVHGGKCYFAQFEPGNPWVDSVNNEVGWTVDFNIKINKVENSFGFSYPQNPDGFGVYLNDGTRMESVYFMTQEILFANANVKVPYDTTENTEYRFVGKRNELKLFARTVGNLKFEKIADVSFLASSSKQRNGSTPAIFIDTTGKKHAVWHDDGNGLGQIYYSVHENNLWSEPELIISGNFKTQYADIVVNNEGLIYVSYQTDEFDNGSIGFLIKNSIGWSERNIAGSGVGKSSRPRMDIDNNNIVHIVWEDHRNGHPEIYYNKWDPKQLVFSGEKRLTNTKFGCMKPVIAVYNDNVFIAYVNRNVDDKLEIKITEINTKTGEQTAGGDIYQGAEFKRSNYPDIAIDHAGKIFLVWNDNKNSLDEIFGVILTPDMDPISDVERISISTDMDSKYPVLSLQRSTGNVYLVWEDYRILSPDIDEYRDPYTDALKSEFIGTLKVAYYDNLQGGWFSSGLGDYDTSIIPPDNRRSSDASVPRSFNGYLDILYKAQIAPPDDEYNEYLDVSDIFSQIRHVSYDLSGGLNYLILSDEYVENDLIVSGKALRKEIRFGDFSDVLSGSYLVKYVRYYTKDAVEPFEASYVSSDLYPINDLIAQDALVNNYGDSWIASNCGLTYYSNISKNVVQNIEGIDGDNIRSISFDQNNVMFVGTDGKILFSKDHVSFQDVTGFSKDEITSIEFDANNNAFIGTKSDGLFIGVILDGAFSEKKNIKDELPNSFVTVIKADPYNTIWIGTKGGLVRYRNGVINKYTSKNGLSSNVIHDIAIRNSAIRYIATPSGIDKMVGTSFERITSENDVIWNSNVKSLAWQEPNILWAGTVSTLNQILMDNDGSTKTISFLPEHYSTASTNHDDYRTYFIISDQNDDIAKDAYVEIYLNGNRIHHGYDVSVSNPEFKTIKFKTKLKHSDTVDVIIRNDIRILSSFAQTDAERRSLGANVVRVKDVNTLGGKIFLSTEGNENEVKLNDRVTSIPFDRVFLDTNKPTGCIEISEQIDRTKVRVAIEDADDGEKGSGVSEMIVSNFPNFTSDGTAELDPIPFSTSIIHDLGLGSDNVTEQLEFDSGAGSKIEYFASVNRLYAATSNPAVLYEQDIASGDWDSVKTFKTDEYIDFIIRYNRSLVVGVGHDTKTAKIHVFPETTSGVNFATSKTFAVSGNRSYSADILNNILYIGTGSDGKIYSFDGKTLTALFSGVDSNVFGLTAGNGVLYAATGPNGRVYKVSPEDSTAIIIHSDSDESVTSLDVFAIDDRSFVFAGTSSEGKIIRSKTSDIAFNNSFQTTSSRSYSVKAFDEDNLYASIGKYVYKMSTVTGSWIWQYTHGTDIIDLALNTNTGSLFVISSASITKIDAPTQSKKIYLKLIDRAGNESDIFDSTGELVECTFAEVSISELQQFVNQYRIVELDSVGNIVDTLNGDDFFYSAKKLDKEVGIYDSEIFNGTNDLIKWDRISWTSTEPTSTEVEIYVRTSATKTDILLKDWIGPYSIEEAGGVSLDSFIGQFIQFRAVLTSQSKDISPTLHNIVIRSITAESIHFFTTNFVLPSRMRKGILTSQNMIPVSADIVFGINTTDSVDWSDYQPIDENRLFNINQIGENLRVGIKLISPGRTQLNADQFDEYGPYSTALYANTVDFSFKNTSTTGNYHFRVTLYRDSNLTDQAFQAFSGDSQLGFNVDGSAIPVDGELISSGSTVNILYTPPASANINCNVFYFVKIESYNGSDYTVISNNHSYISGCSSSFVDTIDFSFTNTTASTGNYHFRVKFFEDGERTDLYLTKLSANDTTGWLVNNGIIPDEGFEVNPGETVNVDFSPNLELLEANKIYYLTIDAFNGSSFVLASNSYTFQARDVDSSVYCGPYFDVPVVKNFALLFELDNNEFITLNLT